MKKLVKSRKNRLVKTALLSLVVTAALLFSYGASAGIQGDMTQSSNHTPLRADDSRLSQSEQMNEPLGDRSEVLLKYHGAQYTGIGFGGAADWEGAMRLTPTELTPVIGWNITEVNYYYYDAVSINGAVRIYGAGTSTTPGTLLQETNFTISGAGTKTLVLSAPVYIDGTDLWVSILWHQTAAGYPFGADAGPMVSGKGGWLYDSYYGWVELTYFGLNYNWCVSAKAVGAVFADDVGVTSIIAPVSSTVSGAITPKVNVKNFGGAAQTNVPVDITITRYGTPATIWTDGFETYTPGSYIMPQGWTVTTTNPTGTWYMYSSSTTYSASTYPRVQELLSDGLAQDEYITSPTIDCSALTYVHLQMTKYFYVVSPDVSSFTILGSNDNGATFPYTLATYTATSSTAENINISTWAAGQNDVKIRIRYTSGADATLSGYAYFDNFWVGHSLTPAWGPLGDVPPIGWTISNSPANPTVWNNNYWHRYTSTYTSYDSMYYPARIYYVSPYEDVDCSLITPTINCAALSHVELYINGYFYYYAGYTHGAIEVSNDGGTTWNVAWNFLSTLYNYEFNGYNNFDITPWAAGQANVKVRFRYYHTAAENGRYWYLGNVRVGSDRNNIIFYDSFNGVQAYSTNFKVWQPDVWTNWAWNRVTGTSAGNQWMNVISGTSPTCTPDEGARMAEYNSYSAIAGDQARIYTDAFDASSAVTLKMSFAMYHDSGDTSADIISVQASIDNGATWTTIDSFNRYSTTTAWTTHIVDLGGYEDATSLRIGFLATSAYGNNMFIDDVVVFDPGLVTEYTNTVNVNVNPGETVQATFPAWTPAAWQMVENADVIYDVAAATDLTGDMDPSNDGIVAAATLHYPYFHDIQVLSIDAPITNEPGQTQEVKATIKNIGQYPERNFFVPVQIGEKIYSTDGYFNNFDANDGGFVQTGSQWEWGTPTSGPGAAHSGTKLWATKLAGNYVAGAANLVTTAIPVPVGGDLTFWHWYDFENAYDGYNVKIATSPYTTWTLMTPVGGYTGTANSANPLYPQPIWTNHVQKFWEYETFDLAAYEGQTVKFKFDFGADTSVFYPGAYVDDILVGTLTVTIDAEYDESAAVASWLQPGSSLQLTYPDWTPENLAIGTSGDIEYGVQANALNGGDTNPANNQMTSNLVLSYWHDVGIKKITSPGVKGDRDVLFHQRVYTPTESWTFRNSGTTYLCQDNFWDLTAPIGNFEVWGLCLIYSGGWTPGNQNALPFTVKFYNDNAGAPGAEAASFNLAAITPVNTGLTYSGFTMYYWNFDLPTAVALEDGWIGISATGPDNGVLMWGGSPEGDVSMYQQGASVPHIAGDCAFNLSGSAGGTPGVSFYAKPGTQNIANIVTNLGTFVETGLTCYAEIWEYISSENGTLVYTDDVADLTLDPLGDEETLTFDSYNFALEGIYGLKFNFPLAGDDVEANNMKNLGIGIDSTAPVSTATISPATPDGQNGWYKSDVTITLAATDPEGHDVTSGVQKIEYQVDGGSWQTYAAPFKVTTDNAAHVVKYKATDKVGNVEAEKTVPSFKIDKTIPLIAMNYTWEKVGSVYNIIITATCSDAMSNMAKVEFYFNGELQETVTGAGPDYVWTYQYTPLQNVVIKGIAYDNCGLNDYAELKNPTSTANQQSSQQSHTTVLMK